MNLPDVKPHTHLRVRATNEPVFVLAIHSDQATPPIEVRRPIQTSAEGIVNSTSYYFAEELETDEESIRREMERTIYAERLAMELTPINPAVNKPN